MKMEAVNASETRHLPEVTDLRASDPTSGLKILVV
jgi:hypothetical protein